MNDDAKTFAARRGRIAEWLKERGIAAAVFEDREGRRDPTVRYLSGQPGDSLLLVTAAGRGVLVSWDVNMARKLSRVDEILAYGDFERKPVRAVLGVLAREGIRPGSQVELPSTLAYPEYIRYAEEGADFDFLCREDGADEFARGLRAVKDESEIAVYRRASAVTDELVEALEAGVRKGTISTESDAALFLERESRARGCEGMGFETLAAGPARSFGIHAFPTYTSGAFGTAGLSILDFGVCLEGYTTDVTLTFVSGRPSALQERMIALVVEAYKEAAGMLRPGVPTLEVARRVDEIFAAGGFKMPHALGHGIGLEAHEAPAMRNRDDNPWVLAPGHIVTLEPGLYDPEAGGVRLENDFLVLPGGAEALTRSRIVRL
ncbi:MAG TPA: Xaa-Pro peptidase family protein [Spirochaetia bacterium]|nr:Xaa-Pro peptidase family protein [Spirochaetales bacterium]HRY78886.1 Xaa-Pro peptidase family protein [Spirochaetia bacterium]